jgi:FG-GAP-like repeat
MSRASSASCLSASAIFLTLSANVAFGVESPRFVEIPIGEAKANYAGVAMGDLDKDGRAEIVAGRREQQEGLYLFSFSKGKWIATAITKSGEYGGIALADITGDGLLDVIAAKTAGSPAGLELFQTRLVGGKLQFDSLPSPFTEAACDDVAVGDVESDGDTDIAVSTGGRGLQVLLNAGKAKSFSKLSLPTDVYEDTGIALGDVNGDGRLDVISNNHPGKNLRLFLCSRTGKVSYSSAYTEGLPGAGIGYRIAIEDLNGDKLKDLAIGGTQGGLRLFLGNGCRGEESTWWKESRLAEHGSQTMQVSVGDLDRDGKPDLAFSSSRGIIAVLNQGQGVFSPRLKAGLPESGNSAGCCLFDWDKDGDLDLACTKFQGEGENGGGIRFFENRAK